MILYDMMSTKSVFSDVFHYNKVYMCICDYVCETCLFNSFCTPTVGRRINVPYFEDLGGDRMLHWMFLQACEDLSCVFFFTILERKV